VKRSVDVAVAAGLLALALPLLPPVVLAIKIESPGPVFFRAARVGYHLRPIGVWKFRKMRVDALGSPLTVAGDERLTRVGRVLAKTHLDEVPQLWNVLRGDMSLVGPRPEDERFVAMHPLTYQQILSVRPGITGWTQLVYADEPGLLATSTDPVDYYVTELLPDKMRIDQLYISDSRSIDDLKVLMWTPAVALLGRQAVVDGARARLTLARRAA
jgi:lipopolysaccharide/colanic/teichoic acid biosynthesis glycosyltransferase